MGKNIRSLLVSSESINVFLSDFFTFKKESKPGYSLRLWAKRLGYENPSLISDILNNRRKANLEFIENFTTAHKLSALENIYFKNKYFLEKKENEEKRHENQSIAEYWTHGYKNYSERLPVDSLILSIVNWQSPAQSMSLKELQEKTKHFIEKNKLIERIDFLSSIGILHAKESNICILKDAFGKRLLKTESFNSLLPLLEKSYQLPLEKTHCLHANAHLTPEAYSKAINIMQEAVDKIGLLAMETEKTKSPRHELYCFTSSFFNVNALAKI